MAGMDDDYHIRKRSVFEFLEDHGLVGAGEADACISGVECKNCRYWQARADSRFGECRRCAPVTRREGDLAMWPAPRDDDWCGEWEGKA